MNSEVIKKEDNKITLKVIVEANKFEEAVNKAYSKMKAKFNVPGFRKGKAPRKIIESNYGVEIFYEEAVNLCFPQAYEEALKAHNIDPINRPSVDIGGIKKGEDVEFTAVVEVMPEFTVENYKGIEAEKKEYNVQEEDVDKEIKALAEKNARIITVEDRPVKEGDILTIDFTGYIEGTAFPGGTAEKHQLTIGSKQFIEGFEEQLIGVGKGEETEVKVTFPEKYHDESLSGKDAVFKVIIHEIKEKELPVIDDEFAKDVSEFNTLEELKSDIVQKLQEQGKKNEEQELKNSVIAAVVNKVKLEIPKIIVNKNIDGMIKDFEYQLRSRGMSLQNYFDITTTDEAYLREQMREDAKNKAKMQLVLEKISQLENIQATEEELEAELQKIADNYKQDIEKIKSNMEEEDMLYLKDTIIRRKTIDFLVENAKIS